MIEGSGTLLMEAITNFFFFFSFSTSTLLSSLSCYVKNCLFSLGGARAENREGEDGKCWQGKAEPKSSFGFSLQNNLFATRMVCVDLNLGYIFIEYINGYSRLRFENLTVPQPDQVFWTKYKNVNLQHSQRPPYPVCDKGGLIDWLIFRIQIVRYRYRITIRITHLYEGGWAQRIFLRPTLIFADFVNNCTYVIPRITCTVVFAFQAV